MSLHEHEKHHRLLLQERLEQQTLPRDLTPEKAMEMYDAIMDTTFDPNEHQDAWVTYVLGLINEIHASAATRVLTRLYTRKPGTGAYNSLMSKQILESKTTDI